MTLQYPIWCAQEACACFPQAHSIIVQNRVPVVSSRVMRLCILLRLWSTHATRTRKHARTTQHQEHKTQKSRCSPKHGLVTRATDTRACAKGSVTAPAQAVQLGNLHGRGDASHTLTTLRKGRPSPVQYKLFSSSESDKELRFSHNCFFQIHIKSLPVAFFVWFRLLLNSQ